jgi:hypothetical protein
MCGRALLATCPRRVLPLTLKSLLALLPVLHLEYEPGKRQVLCTLEVYLKGSVVSSEYLWALFLGK